MRGSLPWKKLQDEEQCWQNVVLQNTAERSPSLQSTIIASAYKISRGGEWCAACLGSLSKVQCVCVCVRVHTVSVTKQGCKR